MCVWGGGGGRGGRETERGGGGGCMGQQNLQKKIVAVVALENVLILFNVERIYILSGKIIHAQT